MTMTRRNFIRLTAAGLLAAPAWGVASTASTPRRLKLTLSPEQRYWYAPAGEPVALWGFDRDLLRLRQGEPVEIEVENRLPEPTTVHWHGLRIDNAMDGVSGLTQAPIAPGARFIYRFTPEDAGTFWAHSHHRTFEQLARGLYMPLIVEEKEPVDVDRELTLAFDDWRLNAQHQLDTESFGSMHDWAHAGRLGNLLTTNRLIKPGFNVQAGERVRLRLLNTANARILLIRLPQVPSWIVAKDGQPWQTPVELKGPLIMAPAERYDLIVDIPRQGPDSYAIQAETDQSGLDLAFLQVDGAVEHRRQGIPQPLPANPLPGVAEGRAVHRVQLDMTGGAMGSLRQAVYQGQALGIRELVQKHQIWAFNGVANMPEKPLLEVRHGDLVEIEILNNTRWPHSMHLHGHHFRSDLARYDAGIWHDTLAMAAGERATIRFRAGKPGDWLLHCHMIEHQAAGMVSWIRVVA